MAESKKAGKKKGTVTVTSHGPRASLSDRQVAQIRAATMLDERVIRKWATGQPVRNSTDHACRRTADRLGFEVIA